MNADPKPDKPQFEVLADEIATSENTDVLYFNGTIDEHRADRRIIEICRKRRRRRNVLMILVTYGGDANAAYRIARCLQQNFEQFRILISGFCKSAGTLVAIGAHEIIISDDGEMGPLDVQLLKKDELFETQSGLTEISALQTLNEQAFEAFEHFLLTTKRRGRPSITARMATDIAERLTTGLFAPIYSQIDPMHVGESGRANRIALQYGEILVRYSKNLDPALLAHLTSHYSSHDFVIDRCEAELIFERVREPNEKEKKLIAALGPKALWPRAGEDEEPWIAFISSELPPAEAQSADEQTGGGEEDGHISEVSREPSSAAAPVSGGSPAETGDFDGARRTRVRQR